MHWHISKKIISMCKKDSLINNRNDLFMSFNYTDTLEKVYGMRLDPRSFVPDRLEYYKF